MNGLRLKLEKISSNFDSSSMTGAENTLANSFLKVDVLSEHNFEIQENTK